MEIRSKRIESLQGLRAIAFLAIFISHSRIFNCGYLGAWGVSIFFVLSGFLMTYNYMPRQDYKYPSPIVFGWQKIKKLYPLHIVTMILCLIYSILNGEGLQLFLITVLHVLLLQIWIPNSLYYETLNGVSWYLCVCLFTYICFPLIVKVLKKIQNKKCLFVCLFGVELCISAFAYYFGASLKSEPFSMQWITYYFPVSRLVDFTIGCCLGAIYIESSKNSINITDILAQVVVPLILLISFYCYRTGKTVLGQEYAKYSLLFVPTSCLIIWKVAKEKTFCNKVLSNRLLHILGDLSPYAFLIHTVIIKYLFAANHIVLNNKVNAVWIALVSFVLTVIGSKVWIRVEFEVRLFKERNLKCEK